MRPDQVRRLIGNGIRSYDALHAACAIVGKADVFVTTDDRLLKRLRSAGGIVAMLPQDALAFVEGWYAD
jgi:predicted nucleic acid-binding protein